METFSAKELAGERLDAALAVWCGLSRARARRLIEVGRVLVDGRPAKASHRLRGRETVAWEPPPTEPTGPCLEPEAIPLDILFEDDWLLVLNKPPGLVVHPGAGHRRSTLAHALLHHTPGIAGVGGEGRPGLVHRLDKDTSGLLVVAKTAEALLGLARQFKEGRVFKLYLALVLSEPLSQAGLIRAPIGRHPTERQRMAVREGGRAAETEWRVRERFGGCCTLMEFRLHTGRTHQIRVHAARVLGCPVAGDAVYGGRHFGALRGPLSARQAVARSPRQLLHAHQLGFEHPATGGPLRFEAPLPADFAAVLAALREAAP